MQGKRHDRVVEMRLCFFSGKVGDYKVPFKSTRKCRSTLQQAVENGIRRIAEIDRLIEKVFEQNAGGILSDERFAKMLQNYEKEQKTLTQEVEENRQTLQNAEQRVMDLRLVLRTLREMTDIKELTPTLVNSLIERIEVHNSENFGGHSHVNKTGNSARSGKSDSRMSNPTTISLIPSCSM